VAFAAFVILTASLKSSESSSMILAGDLGGTKTLIGLFADGEVRPEPVDIRAYTTLDYPGLPKIVDEFLGAQKSRPEIAAAAFGVAGPVLDQSAEMTNVPWHVNAAELHGLFGLSRVRLLNDLEAMAYSLPVLNESELHQLQRGDRDARGNLGLIAAGTGLGTSLVHCIDGRYVPVASEGGHTDYAGRTDRELEFVKFLRDRYGRAEVEQVLSGPGLINLSDFTHQGGRCADLDHAGDSPDVPAIVSKAALEGRCMQCVEALDLFVAAYGAMAGNLALTAVTRGGMFIGGGIAPRILPALTRPAFLEAFNAKDPMRPLLEAMPVNVILNAQSGLLGAAVYAAQLIRTG
jgi:glucokinase